MSPPDDTRPIEDLVDALSQPSSYPHPVESPIVVHQTHISWVFLAGPFAYKVKKPIRNEFLDYTTLESRQRFCEEEVRLDGRYAEGLYLGVVPIRSDHARVEVEGDSGKVIEYAVKMHRFSEQALMSHRLRDGNVTTQDLDQLTDRVCQIHAAASRVDPAQRWGSFDVVTEDALDNFRTLAKHHAGCATTESLRRWTESFAEQNRERFERRVTDGFVRECHGDLHLANVVQWRGKMLPFDGIEFCDRFRWIDVVSDAAFLAMDLAAQGRTDLSNRFVNLYLESTGDYGSLAMFRWYLVYRAMVRAKVACLTDELTVGRDGVDDQDGCRRHIELATTFASTPPRRLWITHGLSGSGKTYGSDHVVEGQGAIRVRSDLERKRLFGMSPTDRPNEQDRSRLYDQNAGKETYDRLASLTRAAIDDGFGVVVDATFLRWEERKRFRQLADEMDAEFRILHFDADDATLRRRVASRAKQGTDASDANLAVLEQQLANREPFRPEELADVVTIRAD